MDRRNPYKVSGCVTFEGALTRTGCAAHSPHVTHRPGARRGCATSRSLGLPHLGQGADAPRHPTCGPLPVLRAVPGRPSQIMLPQCARCAICSTAQCGAPSSPVHHRSRHNAVLPERGTAAIMNCLLGGPNRHGKSNVFVYKREAC